jgi:hypothetical protein
MCGTFLTIIIGALQVNQVWVGVAVSTDNSDSRRADGVAPRIRYTLYGRNEGKYISRKNNDLPVHRRGPIG